MRISLPGSPPIWAESFYPRNTPCMPTCVGWIVEGLLKKMNIQHRMINKKPNVEQRMVIEKKDDEAKV